MQIIKTLGVEVMPPASKYEMGSMTTLSWTALAALGTKIVAQSSVVPEALYHTALSVAIFGIVSWLVTVAQQQSTAALPVLGASDAALRLRRRSPSNVVQQTRRSAPPQSEVAEINLWDRVEPSDIEHAEKVLEALRAELHGRRTEELMGQKPDRTQPNSAEQAIAEFLDKFRPRERRGS